MSRMVLTPVSGSLFQTTSRIVTFSGTAKVMPRSWHSSTSYFSFSPTVWPQMSQTSPRASLARPHRGQSTSLSPYGIGDEGGPAVGARLAQVVQPDELAALALPVPDRVLDELERGVLPEVGDREDRLEHRLQAGVFALGRQAVHLEKALVRVLLDLDQVRDRNRRLDLREVDALSVNVLGKAVHPVKVPTTAPRRAGRDGWPRFRPRAAA